MELEATQVGDTLLISIVGSLDALTAHEADNFLQAQTSTARSQVVLDLRQVDFMSSSGIRTILGALKRSRRDGGDLRVAAMQPGVHRTLEISGLLRVLKTYPSVEEAVQSFSP
jgi:anti-sigma B factor antagonist